MHKSAPQPISDILKDVVEKLSRRKEKGIAKVLSLWPGVAGKELSRHTTPLRLQKRTLLVSADESVWLYQASLKKESLLKALQKKIGKEKIEKIQFRIGNIKKITKK